jgi:hypothetical protein
MVRPDCGIPARMFHSVAWGLLAFLIATGCWCGPAHAQDSTRSAAPLDQEKAQDPDEMIRWLLFGSPGQRIEFHGFLNFEGYAFQDQAEHDKSSFDLHNFYLAAKAPITRDIALFGEVEYEHGATIRLDRAFVDWTVHSLLTLRMGRFYVPVSYERAHYWAPIRPMTGRPLPVDIPFHEWADTGFELFGRQGWFGYDVGVVNGPFALTENGIPITDVRDNNDNKTPFARLNLYPERGIEAGVAYSQGAFDRNGDLKFKLLEIDSRLHRGPLDVWAEYDRRFGDDEPAEGEPGYEPLFTGDRGRKEGYYVLVACQVASGRRMLNYLKPMVRFDRLEVLDAHSGLRRLTVGLNWSPEPHVVFKSEYQWTDEFGGPHLRNNGAMMSVVADF